MIGPIQQKYFRTEGFEGNPALADVEREMVEDMQLTLNALSLPARIIGMGVENLCNSHPAAQSICNTIGEYVVNPAHYVPYILETHLPTPLNHLVKQTFERYAKTPDLWEEKYDIPKEHSQHSLESLNIVLGSAIGGGLGAVVARVPNALRKLRTTWKYLPERLAAEHYLIHTFKRENRIIYTNGNQIKFLHSYMLREDGALRVFVDELISKSTKSSGAAIRAFKEIKELGEKLNAGIIELQFCPFNLHLFEVTKKNFPYLGKQKLFHPHNLVGGETAPVFLLSEGRLPPRRAISHMPAKAGAIAPLILHPLNKDFINQPESLVDAIMSVAFMGRIKIPTLTKPMQASRKAILQFLKNDAGSIAILPGKKPSVSTKEMVSYFKKVGYEVVQGGKGSHIKLKKPGRPPIIMPNEKTLPKGLAIKLWKIVELETKTTKGALVALGLLSDSIYNARLDGAVFKPNFSFSKRDLFQITSTIQSKIDSLADATIFSPELATLYSLETLQYEEDEMSSKQESSSLELTLPEVNGLVPLDHPKKTSMTLTMPAGKGTQIGASVPFASPQDSTLSAETHINNSQVGVLINPRNLKASSISVMRSVGEGVNLGVGINPMDPKKVQAMGSIPIGSASVGGVADLRNPMRSTVSVTVPVYGIPVGVSTRLNHLEKARVTVGYPGTPLQVSFPVGRIFKKAFKLFGKKKKHKKKKAEYSNYVPKPTLFQQTQKNLKDLELAAQQLQHTNEDRQVAQNALHFIEQPQKLDQLVLKKEITVNSLKDTHNRIQEKVELLQVHDETSVKEFKNVANGLIATLSNEGVIQKVKSKISPQKKSELRKLRLFE